MTVEKIRQRKCRSFIKIDLGSARPYQMKRDSMKVDIGNSVFIGCLAKSGHEGDHHYTGVSDDRVPKPIRVEWHTFNQRRKGAKSS